MRLIPYRIIAHGSETTACLMKPEPEDGPANPHGADILVPLNHLELVYKVDDVDAYLEYVGRVLAKTLNTR